MKMSSVRLGRPGALGTTLRPDARRGGDFGPGQTAGVYKVEKDALTPCDGPEGKRPKGFTLEDKSGEYLMIFKRVKPRP
jgi:hypothetical protein